MSDNKLSPAILVISHGDFCEALIRSAFMIFGTVDRVEALPLVEGMDVDIYQTQFQALIEKYDGNVFVLADLKGGTPFKTLMMTARTRPLYGVVGVNIPLMIEVLSLRDELAGAELAAALATAYADLNIDLTQFLEKAYCQERG